MDQNTCECGLPLDSSNSCTCQPNLCVHCCTCEEGCTCDCKTKAAEL